MRPPPRYDESRLSLISAITGMTSMTADTLMTTTSSVMVEPGEQAGRFQHNVRAQPSFELRPVPPGSWAFQALNAALLLLLAAAAVLDYLIKTGRWGSA